MISQEELEKIATVIADDLFTTAEGEPAIELAVINENRNIAGTWRVKPLMVRLVTHIRNELARIDNEAKQAVIIDTALDPLAFMKLEE